MAAPRTGTVPVIRAKRAEDVPSCVAGLREVHAADGYPETWPDDPAAWLHPEASTLAAWVAVEAAPAGDGVVGCVVLRRGTGHHDVEAVAAITGAEPAAFGLVSRLWVRPAARGRGTARRLLATAAGEARRRGLRPMLDVVATSREAVRLYEAAGWERVGCRPFTFPDGLVSELYYYLCPMPA